MKLREFVEINHECGTLYIRESDGNFSRPVFTRRLTTIPDDLLDREVKHIQAGVENWYGRVIGCLLITLYMSKEGEQNED